MTSRPALLLGAALLLGGSAAGFLAAQPGKQPPPAGPYQATGVGNYLVLTDPATGQSWARLVQKPEITDDPTTAWVALGSPVKK